MHPYFTYALADEHRKELHAMAPPRSHHHRRGARADLLGRRRFPRLRFGSRRPTSPTFRVDDLSWAWGADDEPFGPLADPSRPFDAP